MNTPQALMRQFMHLIRQNAHINPGPPERLQLYLSAAAMRACPATKATVNTKGDMIILQVPLAGHLTDTDRQMLITQSAALKHPYSTINTPYFHEVYRTAAAPHMPHLVPVPYFPVSDAAFLGMLAAGYVLSAEQMVSGLQRIHLSMLNGIMRSVYVNLEPRLRINLEHHAAFHLMVCGKQNTFPSFHPAFKRLMSTDQSGALFVQRHYSPLRVLVDFQGAS